MNILGPAIIIPAEIIVIMYVLIASGNLTFQWSQDKNGQEQQVTVQVPDQGQTNASDKGQLDPSTIIVVFLAVVAAIGIGGAAAYIGYKRLMHDPKSVFD